MNEGRREGLTVEALTERRRQRHESRTQQTYKQFLKRLAAQTDLPEQDAQMAAVSILCGLEQRLMREEGDDLEAQLPFKLRELLQRCERHEGRPPVKFGRDEFLELICEDLGVRKDRVESLVRDVFAVLREQVSEGEIQQVIDQLPKDFRDLWQRPT